MSTTIISTKEIRNDLEGFLRKIRAGQTFKVMYRSKPIVTVAAKEENDPYLSKDAGTPAAARRSMDIARRLSSGQTKLDPNKSFKELYNETQQL
jgi:antitoxin (DNA-binding transcriptional repressor) of toxin-antitoxin stability system